MLFVNKKWINVYSVVFCLANRIYFPILDIASSSLKPSISVYDTDGNVRQASVYYMCVINI